MIFSTKSVVSKKSTALKVAIADKHSQLISKLQNELYNYNSKIETIYKLGNAKSLTNLLESNKVNLLFLDVELSNELPFSLIKSLHENGIYTIYTSDRGQYTYRSFKFEGIDYLLKPFEREEIESALKRVEKYFSR
jgi:two-component system, LytTR family, response regulator LytT